MEYYVIEFNRRTRERRVTRFSTTSDAVRFRLERERERTDLDIEIAALTTTSLAGLQRTHSRYFTGVDIGEELAG